MGIRNAVFTHGIYARLVLCSGAFSAPRVWWMFRVFGHGAVSLLDGGFKNWELEGRPVTEQYTKPSSAEFCASLNRAWVKTYQDILDNLHTKKFQVVDARPAGRFRGLDPEPRRSKWFIYQQLSVMLITKLHEN